MPVIRAPAVYRNFRPPFRKPRPTAPATNKPLTLSVDSYNVTAEQLFDLFGKFGPIR